MLRPEVKMEYGIRLASGQVVVGPGWECEADVVAASHGWEGMVQGTDHGELVRRAGDALPWVPVR